MKEMHLCILVILTTLSSALCDNILILHPFYGGSHVLTLRRLAESLTERSHEVTIIRWLDTNSYSAVLNPKITEIALYVNNSDNSIPHVSHEEKGRFQIPIKRMWERGLRPTIFPVDGFGTVAAYCETLLGNGPLIHKLERRHFKVAIVDIIFNECGLALAYHLGLPTIGFWGFNFASGYTIHSTAFNPPSSLPQTFSSLKDDMNFLERVTNTMYFIVIYLLIQFQFSVADTSIQRHIYHAPHPSQLIANMSGILINSHPAIDYPRLLPPTYLEVAGMQMRPTQQLPRDIAEFIASAGDDGVILFSLGFNFDIQYIPKTVFETYFKAFGRLKQKVIVKAKGRPSQVPANVQIYSFFPQADILAHSKTLLFVSHCGVHGVMEAVENAVPLVCIPIFVDQRDNLVRLMQFGVAKGFHKESSEDQIYDTITSVLTNSSYKENMIKLRKRVRQFGNPLERAVWLVEYVMETDGADHLKLAARHLGIFQYLCLDVFLFLFVVGMAIVCAIYRVISKVSQGILLDEATVYKLKTC